MVRGAGVDRNPLISAAVRLIETFPRLCNMWSAIRWLVLRIAAIRWFFKMGWLGLLVPIALLLKTIGLPLLAILAVVAIPLLILLLLFGLPILLVLVFGAMVMGFLGFVLTMGIVAI